MGCSASTIIDSARAGDLKQVKECFKNGQDIEMKGAFGFTPLLCAADNARTDVAVFLIDSGANVEATTEDGKTALIYAASNGDLELVTHLVQRGANIGAITERGRKAQDFAALYKQQKVLEFFQFRRDSTETLEG